MAEVIHARRRPGTDDQLRFRIWSTVSDSYLTDEMSERQLKEWLLQREVYQAIQAHLQEIDGRIARASQWGTSSLIDARNVTEIDNAWEEERG